MSDLIEHDGEKWLEKRGVAREAPEEDMTKSTPECDFYHE